MTNFPVNWAVLSPEFMESQVALEPPNCEACKEAPKRATTYCSGCRINYCKDCHAFVHERNPPFVAKLHHAGPPVPPSLANTVCKTHDSELRWPRVKG